VHQYGKESWELDALTPQFLNDLVAVKVGELVDEDAWEERVEQIADIRARLQETADNFDGE
jgi:hypothetical protein